MRLRRQKMSREIRRGPDNTTCDAVWQEPIAKGYGELPKLMFERRANRGIEARYDPCFFAAPPDKIVFLATVAILEEIDMDNIIIRYRIDEPRGNPEISASTKKHACARAHFDIPPK